ncbi:MAG TPA: hypothetical protein PKZ76_04590, partial [Xanthomonadaceae bacterium]|nr:hypothetical protein [Xanthomonadaceae bacterium]
YCPQHCDVGKDAAGLPVTLQRHVDTLQLLEPHAPRYRDPGRARDAPASVMIAVLGTSQDPTAPV